MRSEFQFIRHIKEQYSLSHVGDDCAVLPKDEVSDLLVTADLLIEDIDFRLEWAKPADIGHKSLAVSLSDIAAMGGTPTFALVSIGVPKQLWKGDFVENFYFGWHELAGNFDVELVGGDLSASNKLVIDSVVLGQVPKGKAIRRSGAKPGDLIFVSGSLGGAAAGLRLIENTNESRKWGDEEFELVSSQLRPRPNVELAKQLCTLDVVTSMIDISDGLSSDLHHLCEASGVGAVVEADVLPSEPALIRLYPDENERLSLMLDGGEDFELLFTVSPDACDLLSGLPVSKIGTIDAERSVEIQLVGKTVPLEPGGFQHF